MSPHSRLRIFLLTASLVSLSSCVSTDPNFNSLAAKAETHPHKNAIIGMWCEKENPLGYAPTSVSLLFKADGTFVQRVAVQTLTKDVFTDNQIWKYQGNGVWTVEMKGPWVGTKTDRYRISGGKLLRETICGFGPVKRVYSRME